MTKSYQIVPPPGSPPPLDPKQFADLLANDGQLLLPLLDLLENAQCAIDDLIDVMGRATIEAVLRMSAATIAGPEATGQEVRPRHRLPRHPAGPRRAEGPPTRRREAPAAAQGPQGGRPSPRSRSPPTRRCARKAAWPIGCSRSSSPASRPGVTKQVLPEMAETVGVSKSQVSRETIEAGERLLEDLAGRDFSALDLLAVWIDGVQLGSYHVICAAGSMTEGRSISWASAKGRPRTPRWPSRCSRTWPVAAWTRSDAGCS